MSKLTWAQTAPGVWRCVVGRPSDFTPLAVIGVKPQTEALEAMGRPAFPFDERAIAAQAGRCRTVACFPLGPDEKVFGLGLQFMKLNQRGRTRYLRVNSDPQQDTGETHAPVPFYVSSQGYGVLANTARIVTIYCASCTQRNTPSAAEIADRNTDPNWPATGPSESVEIVVGAPGLELLVFAGPTALDAVRRYNLYCGGGALPPRWGLGFWHRVPTTFSADQVMAEADEFRQRDLPCDVIGLEPGWHSASYPCTYEWSPERFPRPAELVQGLLAKGFRTNLWEHAYVSPAAKIHAPLQPLSGSHTVWGGLVPDYSLEQARAILQAQHDREHVSIGVSGYKIDECDGSELTGCSWMFPGHATFPSGRDGEEMRQVYGLVLQAMTRQLFGRRDRRTYGLVRASTTGASSLPYVLYSDLYDHRQFVRALCNSGFSGLLWCPEIRDAANGEEWVRRLQVVCFSPLAMLNAWGSGRKPWSFPEVEPIVRKYVKLRMRLLPYLYSAFARYHFDGTPPFRAMALECDEAAERDDQYFVGDSLLVAPLFAGQESREVFLPKGAWHDFETGERHEGGGIVTVSPGLDRIPVFVRDGGIVPLMPALAHAPGPGEAVALEVHHYGSAPGRFRLFDDDGETYAYEGGRYRWRVLEVAVSPDGERRGRISPVEEGGWASSYGEVTWRFVPG